MAFLIGLSLLCLTGELHQHTEHPGKPIPSTEPEVWGHALLLLGRWWTDDLKLKSKSFILEDGKHICRKST